MLEILSDSFVSYLVLIDRDSNPGPSPVSSALANVTN